MQQFRPPKHLRAKKHLGQNFLKSAATLAEIVETANIQKEDTIIEVGPGKGVLTEEILKRCKKLIAIEKDPDLIPLLKIKFKNYQNLNLIEGDVLKLKVPEEPYKVVANIPYYITSPILNFFLRQKSKPTSLTLLVQKEVAEKICAKAGDHSIMSLQVQLFGEPEIKSIVPKTHFEPVPKVDSAIIFIRVYEQSPYKNPLEVLKIAKLAFSGKRKKLKNTIIKSLQLDAAETEKNAEIDLNRRPETLSLEEWQQLLKSFA